MKRVGYILIGTVAGAILAVSAPAVGAWLVSSSGEASVTLARLEAVGVGKATLSDEGKALPGKKLALVADFLDNPNGVTVQVLDSTLKTLETDDPDCRATLGNGVKYTARSSFDLADGKTDDVVLGTVALGALANSCQGAVLEGTVALKVGYGS